MQRITPCLWFDTQAEEAAKLYVSLFPNSRIGKVTRYGEAGKEVHGRPAGSVMTVEFELDGQKLTALNGGPLFKFNESVSLQVSCATQREVDHYWNGLSAGGDPKAQQCGWLKDRFGLSWQVVPAVLPKLLSIAGPVGESVMAAMLQMRKLDIAALERAAREKAQHIRTAPAGKAIKVTSAGQVIAESRDALAMREGDYPVVYYVPRKDVRMERFERSSLTTHCPFKGDAAHYSLKGGPRDAAWSYEAPFEQMQAIAGYVAFYPNKVDSISIG